MSVVTSFDTVARQGFLSLPSLTSERDTIDALSVSYQLMATTWELLHSLKGGTRAMRDAQETWLPMEPKERRDKYDLRLERSILYGAYTDTVRRLTSKPFSNPVVIEGVENSKLETMLNNVDKEGSDITQFAKRSFEASIDYGMSHILVDFPRMQPGATLKDEQGVFPTWIHVPPPALIGWRYEKGSVGENVLTQIRILEERVEAVGQYNDEVIRTIRLYTPDMWQIWKWSPRVKQWILDEEGIHSLGVVPLVTFYTNKEGFMMSKPPLEDLAWMNLAHWQSFSDQRNILRMARAGLLHTAGFSANEAKKIVIGPNALIKSKSAESKVTWVEMKGDAIKAGERDLEDLQERMTVLGLQPEVARTQNSTATGKKIDESRVESDIQSWIRSCEGALFDAWQMSEHWMKMEHADASFKIFDDFALSAKSTDDIKALIQARTAKEITRKTFLEELKRRGLLSENVDVDKEIEELEEEVMNAIPIPIGKEVAEDDDDDDDEGNEPIIPEQEEDE